ncbi:uncharacterized protein F5891DRAFT_1194498 [Suillus fuscotomentosus]|uniref:Uncharacterized protein n=1 Tax=Suillus fuscotomentosus TaxID=1912939 RepID=A0AAD4DW13_9AGAM|nr:uncharacterized protein F5891DRAFT_1194498 [Suillus fuscotomentosus]KAG1895149.1 hypothetical protein F5891DRAFT_1194498 [Suillus fuscotomentosus]
MAPRRKFLKTREKNFDSLIPRPRGAAKRDFALQDEMRLHGEDATYNSIQASELPSRSTFVHSYQRIISVRGEKDRQEQRSPTRYHDSVSVTVGLGFYNQEGHVANTVSRQVRARLARERAYPAIFAKPLRLCETEGTRQIETKGRLSSSLLRPAFNSSHGRQRQVAQNNLFPQTLASRKRVVKILRTVEIISDDGKCQPEGNTIVPYPSSNTSHSESTESDLDDSSSFLHETESSQDVISHWQAQDASEHSPNEEEFRATSPVSELTMEEIQAEWKPVFRKRARDW